MTAGSVGITLAVASEGSRLAVAASTVLPAARAASATSSTVMFRTSPWLSQASPVPSRAQPQVTHMGRSSVYLGCKSPYRLESPPTNDDFSLGGRPPGA